MFENRPQDTSETAEQVLLEGYRRMSPEMKLQQVRSLTRALYALALSDVKRRAPDVDDRTQKLMVVGR